MSTFIIIAALMTLAALACVMHPLLARAGAGDAGQAQARSMANLAVLRDQLRELDADLAGGTIDRPAYDSARHELEARVATDVAPQTEAVTGKGARRTAVVLVVCLSLGAAGLYVGLGTPDGLDPALSGAPGAAAHEATPEQISGMVERLAQRLKSQPDDREGWGMLARSYAAMGRYQDAADAYKKLLALSPDDAQLMADYADVLAMTRGQSLQGEPEQLLLRAAALDPKSVKAQALLGSAAFERRDFALAIRHWQSVVTLAPAKSDMARMAAGNIREAQAALEGRPPAAEASAGQDGADAAPSTAGGAAQDARPVAAAAAVAAAATAKATGKASVSGTVELSPALRAQAGENDAVFIYARAVNGPRFPLAVLRKQVKDLPLRFTLDDSMGMAAGATLSSFGQVVVGARVSKSGSATPGAGDLEGSTGEVATGSAQLKIVIDQRRQ